MGPNVVLFSGARIGAGCVLQAGVVIGQAPLAGGPPRETHVGAGTTERQPQRRRPARHEHRLGSSADAARRRSTCAPTGPVVIQPERSTASAVRSPRGGKGRSLAATARSSGFDQALQPRRRATHVALEHLVHGKHRADERILGEDRIDLGTVGRRGGGDAAATGLCGP